MPRHPDPDVRGGARAASPVLARLLILAFVCDSVTTLPGLQLGSELNPLVRGLSAPAYLACCALRLGAGLALWRLISARWRTLVEGGLWIAVVLKLAAAGSNVRLLLLG